MITADSQFVTALYPSPNFGARRGVAKPDILLLHYTGMLSCERAIWWLANPKSHVSCHYVVDCDGRITQMVAEELRAWHAGVSSWAGETDINSCSIGIEIHNPGHSHGYPDFGPAQMDAVRELSLDIVTRHRMARPAVLAHSDIAPARKGDPGEKFDWPMLARAGVGHWVEPEPVGGDFGALGLDAHGDTVAEMQHRLGCYGYGIAVSGHYDVATEQVVRAFQRHFRPACVDGRFDRSTSVTLDRLIAALPESGPMVVA